MKSTEDKNNGVLSKASHVVQAGKSFAAGAGKATLRAGGTVVRVGRALAESAGKATLNAGCAAVSAGGCALSNTGRIVYHGVTHSMGFYTRSKDKLRSRGMQAPSAEQLRNFTARIENLLTHMEVSDALQNCIMMNVRKALTLQELTRTNSVLKLLGQHGLRGNAADQFFLGAHFQINDGGILFRKLRELEGAEIRFSSHFKEYRTEELGISAGRLLPEILLLETVQEEIHYSHFQVEASPWRAVPGNGWRNFVPTRQTLQSMEHLYDSIVYFSAKKFSEFQHNIVYNRSSYGWSPYTDDNPITQLDEVPSSSLSLI